MVTSSSTASASGAVSLNERSLSFFVIAVTRLLATNPAAVLAVLAHFSDQARQNGLPVFIENCLSKTDLIREVFRQKATALGLMQFLAPQHSDLLGHITGRVLDFVASVLLELFSDSAASAIPSFTAADFPHPSVWTEGTRVQRVRLALALASPCACACACGVGWFVSGGCSCQWWLGHDVRVASARVMR